MRLAVVSTLPKQPASMHQPVRLRTVQTRYELVPIWLVLTKRLTFYNQASVRLYSYPMSILSELPPLPESGILNEAQSRFSVSFKRHVFLNALDFPDPSSNHIVPPYLKIGLACLGTAASQNTPASEELNPHNTVSAKFLTSDLFLIGDALWGVMMEVDNREARLLESVLAVSARDSASIIKHSLL